MARTLNCVCDAHTPLHPVSLSDGLPALACDTCQGQLLNLNDYRRWLERYPKAATTASSPTSDAVLADAVATPVRKCPACSQLMERLRSGSSDDFRLDRCGPCQWLWMDAGEWAALESSHAADRLLDTLSDGGQRGLRDAAMRQRRETELRARHGDTTIDELVRIRAWLSKQPHPDHLLTLLHSGW